MDNRISSKLDYIDVMRGVAILMVIVHHTAQQGHIQMPHFLSVIFSLGTRGVQLFFIASAFTLFRSYQNRNSLEQRPLRNFYIRRFFRIAPIYYLAIVYYLIRIYCNLPFWLGDQPSVSNSNLLSNILFVHGFSPYWINSLVPGGWSIAVEMLFYSLFPFIFKGLKNINSAFLFLNISLAIKILFQEFFNHYLLINEAYIWREFLFYYFPSQLPIFALGFIMYFLINDINSLKLIQPRAIFVFVLLLFAQIGSTFDFLYFNHIVFGLGFVIFGVLLSSGKLSLLCNPILKFIGKISFSLYVMHFIVIAWLVKFQLIDFTNNYLLNFMTRLLMVSIFSIFLSTLTYYFIEIPFQNFGKKIINKKELK